ncbi:hypothetical protein COY07_00415 [Candidatus Peregrinibacteria bacterium CG_4_10_14_0_2_um_filter_43_11]|nr:MAG: hypothetical protein COY07_00415 [Candidatus Peregrinibacteria bacterium CG_4_10_14_0_2_um_filter_43_11]
MKRSSFAVFGLIIVLSFFSGAFGGIWAVKHLKQPALVQNNGTTIPPAQKERYIEESSIIDTVAKVSPSVVSIVITKDLPLYRQRVFNFNDFFLNDPFSGSPFGSPEPQRDEKGDVMTERRKVGGGSGFIVSADGLVVTNRHVVQDQEANYTVILNDGTEFEADVLSRDPLNDIALLKVKPGEKKVSLPVVSLGHSADLKVGQRVVAIGNALAEYENTVTTGVVSAKGRSIAAGDINSAESLINLIQTDAAINPGNSGGPLVNLNGEVIGINTAIAANAQGIGFAIPIDDVVNAIESVKENGRIVRPFLGVRFMMLDTDRAKELKIDVDGGALLVGDETRGEFAVVPGSPADKAGLKIKDVILEVDGKKITTENPLHILVGQHKPGDTLNMKVWRSGKEMEVQVTLEESK